MIQSNFLDFSKQLKFRCKVKEKPIHITETQKKIHQCRVFATRIRKMLATPAPYLLTTFYLEGVYPDYIYTPRSFQGKIQKATKSK